MRIGIVLSVLVTSCATPQLGDKELPPRPPSLRAAFDNMPSPAKARLRVLSDNVDAWVARWKTIESAQERVDVQYFIIEPDAYGLSLLGLLYEKAVAGKKVRLMVDSRGTPALSRAFMGVDLLQELARVGADVRVYNPVEQNVADVIATGDLRLVAASNHDKLILVDRDRAVTGGRNISAHYLADPRDMPDAYIDMDIFVEGSGAVHALGEAFQTELRGPKSKRVGKTSTESSKHALMLCAQAMRLWLTDPAFSDEELAALNDPAKRDELALVYEGNIVGTWKEIPTDAARDVLRKVTRELANVPRLRGALHRQVPPISIEPEAVRVLDTHSTAGVDQRNRVNENLLAAIQAAEKEVIIQSPYFILTERGMRALEDAASRNVTITILTNSPMSSDSPITQAAFLKQWPEILKRVKTARIFVVAEKRLMHAKVGVMDGVLSFVGSYNLDPLSAGVNGEVLTSVWSEEFATKERDLILNRIAKGAPSVVEYKIRRASDGTAVLDGEQPVVEVGPESHCDADQLKKVKRLEFALDLLAPLL